MNRRLIIAAVVLALGSVSACTPQQIADAVAAQTQAESAQPAVQVDIDCHHLAFTITEPEGTDVFINIGSQPPFGFTVGAEQTWGFTNTDGTYTGSIAISGYDSVHSFTWSVDLGAEAGFEGFGQRPAEGSVTCPA